jgi:hypothetical protein
MTKITFDVNKIIKKIEVSESFKSLVANLNLPNNKKYRDKLKKFVLENNIDLKHTNPLLWFEKNRVHKK